MKRILAFGLISFMVFSCATGPPKETKRASKKGVHRVQKKPPEKSGRRIATSGRKRVSRLHSRLLAPGERIYLPSIIHPGDQSQMVLVNAGSRRAGNFDPRGFQPGKAGIAVPSATLPAFYIDRNEVTVEQYKRFDLSYDEKPYTGRRECPACPAMGIDWESAKRYCLWSGKRLPSEDEWEAAARGPSDRFWPWGNKFLSNHANIMGDADGHALAAPVGSFPLGTSPYGAMDMIGNVWEWVSTAAVSGKDKKDSNQTPRIVKGGGWSSGEQAATIAYRNIVDPALKNPAFGFRCSKPLN